MSLDVDNLRTRLRRAGTPTSSTRNFGSRGVNSMTITHAEPADHLDAPLAQSVVLRRLDILPYVGLVTGLVSVFLPYGLAVYRGDVPAWLPYISDAGGDPPQGAIFSMGMILVGVMFVFGACVYSLLLEAQNVHNNKYVTFLGRLFTVASFIMVLGLFGVATNPTGHLRRDGGWLIEILWPHLAAATVFFTAGISMMALLTITTFLMQKPVWFNKVFLARVSILLGALLGGLLVVVGLPPLSEFDKFKPSPNHGRMYPPGTEISAFGEWLIVIMFMLFVCTFIPEFSRIKLTLVVDYK